MGSRRNKGDGTGERGKKKKPKSVKAKVTSKFSAKRLLSRHGKEKKKGMEGPSTEFVTRSHALKKLQITLKDFRRLCILKGIYPRVPPTKAPKGQDKIYYDIKDLTHLSHEPLLHKFRDFKAFMKKIRKASGRNELEDARRKDELKPQMRLDHLVKERYPRFIDALRDLDDALCMIHLFAAMPSQGRVTAAHTAACGELARHWQYYVAKSRSLTKTFVSVKGVYFQAEIMGEQVTWLSPHPFTQQVPKEVDLRVMITFLDFYEVFVRFSLFKLYSMVGLQYPPIIDKQLDAAGCGLLAVRQVELESADQSSGGNVIGSALEYKASTQSKEQGSADADESVGGSKAKGNAKKGSHAKDSSAAADAADIRDRLQSLNSKLAHVREEDEFDEEEDDDDGEGKVPVAALAEAFEGFGSKDNYMGDDEQRVFTAPSGQEGSAAAALFTGLRFFCNREVPLQWLQLCIVSNGGQIGWEGTSSPFAVSDASITHHIVDRPMAAGTHLPSREYMQPQWVFDSINAQIMLPLGKYAPGSKLPPHLSPFVDDYKEGYVPKYREEITALQVAAGKGVKGASASAAKKSAAKEILGDADSDVDEEDEEQQHTSSARGGKEAASKKRKPDDDEEEEEEQEEEEQPAQLAVNTKRSKGSKGVVFQANVRQQTEDEEAKELSKTMMSKKTARLYQRMQYGIQGKSDEISALEEKAAKAEAQKAAKEAPVAASKSRAAPKGKAPKK